MVCGCLSTCRGDGLDGGLAQETLSNGVDRTGRPRVWQCVGWEELYHWWRPFCCITHHNDCASSALKGPASIHVQRRGASRRKEDGSRLY